MTGPPQDGAPLSHLTSELREILDRLPRGPGVYLLKNREGTIIYVGKAKSLFSRVRSYFSRASRDTRAFVPLLERVVGDVETIVTRNEKEALLLENTLIKRHKPRFNVMLRDDKSYLVLRLDPTAPYPRLEVTRRIHDDGARYFGPYHSATACRQTLRLVNRHFQLRTCSDRTLSSRSRPCLQHQIQRCPAPCVIEVDPRRYSQQVEDVTLFLRGRGAELMVELERRMRQAAEELEFERAARIRDQLAALRSAQQGQQVVGDSLVDQDVVGFHREGDQADLVVLLVRQGKLVGRRPFSFSGQEFPDDELLSGFLSRYYERGETIPRQILVSLELEDREAKRQWLGELGGDPVEILVPKRGDKRRLLELARQNARANFFSRRQRETDVEQSLAKVQLRLRLSRPPRRVECYDVSGFQGELVVASMVVLVDGTPLPAAYRHFTIRSQNKDDFASMYEVLCRRLRRALNRDAGWELPDLFVVDGGKAQLSMALTALGDVGLPDGSAPPDLVALAKERPAPRHRPGSATGEPEGPRRPERVYLPRVKDPIVLLPHTAEHFLLTRIRDEAHRFAITQHKKLRQRRGLRSSLDEIPGIGQKRKRELLKAMGSLRRIREATLEELAEVPSMTSKAAEAVVAYLRSPPGDDKEGEPGRDL
jgi:excinuclease ABC subunit C